MDPKLAEKLTRILALTTSPMEGEAQAATEMLQKLLTKHNLDIADLEAAGKAQAPSVIENTMDAGLGTDGKPAKGNAWFGGWKLTLAEALAEHFYCYAITKTWSRSVVFIGRPDNVESLKLLYNWLVDQISRLTKSERKAYAERTGEMIHAVRWYKAFTEGAVDRLGERLVELKHRQQADVSATALVVHHMAEISDYLESIGRSRVDGKLTAEQQKRRDESERQEAAWQELLKTDPEAAYRQRPWERPQTAEAIAKQLKDEAKRWKAYEKRQANRRPRYMSWEEYDRREQSDKARKVGATAAEDISLQPFVAGGKTKTEVLR